MPETASILKTLLGSDLFVAMCTVCYRCHSKRWVRDWEYTLWSVVSPNGFQLNRIAGIEWEDVAAIQALYRAEDRWYQILGDIAEPVPLEEWRKLYAARSKGAK